MMPLGIKALSEFMVAMRRIEEFLVLSEIPDQQIEVVKGEKHFVRISEGQFKWNSAPKTTLKDIDLEVNQGELVAIVGRIGRFIFLYLFYILLLLFFIFIFYFLFFEISFPDFFFVVWILIESPFFEKAAKRQFCQHYLERFREAKERCNVVEIWHTFPNKLGF